ncbi:MULTISPECIES: hypothetical protein [Methanobacterium]|jgi:hypothetical protein|uniref:Uncharacterized protein n=1 Tax=Methanobacterium subterraneum TaxID=59277 RepID=A0A2H4VAQ1_9EURY|nr:MULTISPECIES: hypothetical protein [Methanobacterium]MBW4256419.1 hypothetical protein [Methanobacterium sp. YSL]PKL71281.1 MAG: hypothetical protein CVV29_11450 [Methanobacteriales archaeon HGW-Methanobacteriales-2]AUB55177.1 hypothetical protein BK007_03545 [Methanobacterium subterraneum]AUB57836.1 hypothetical protein BK008_05585 [Methanobacterium sp. MZ-A1]NMO10400.1 hypothetical protein [Methanobacterium subterraneum]
MDEKGFGYTLDAVLAIIPVMIVLFGVSNLALSPESPLQIHSSQKAHDTMELMVNYREGNALSVLEKMSAILNSGNNSPASITSAGELASDFLDKNLASSEYLLTEESQLGGKALAGRMELKNTDNVATAIRNSGNYTYRIYIT